MPHRILPVLLLMFLVSTTAWAQSFGESPGGGNGGGKGPGDGGKKPPSEDGPVPWSSSYDDAKKGASSETRFILLYVHPAGETKDPAFLKPDALKGARASWVFLKRPFAKDDKELKRLKVTAASTLVGLDLHLNDFKRGSANGETLASIIKGVPPAVQSFRLQISAAWSRAFRFLGTDAEDQAIKPMVEIVATGRRGYKEIVDSLAKIRELGATHLKAIESRLVTDEAVGMKALRDMIELFKGTSAAAAAENRLARLEPVSSGLLRVLRISKCDDDQPETMAAAALLKEMVAAGNAQVDGAVQQAAAGQVEAARAALARLVQDYRGTDVEKRAEEALKALPK